MTINLVMLLILILSLVQFAVVLRKMEMDARDRSRSLGKLEEEHNRLTSACEAFAQVAENAESALSEATKEVEKARNLKDVAEAELKAVEDQPKERLFVNDKHTIIHAKLWEVSIANATLVGAARPPPTADEWMSGRVFVIGGATERDARQRAETRFPTSQGYRIVQVERFRRA